MPTIIAGRIEAQERVERVVAALREGGVPAGDIQTFYVNPPGQHATYRAGGDPGARGASPGAAAGAVIGAAAGAAAGAATAGVVAPLIAPAVLVGLTGAGAHVGGLAGALSGTRDAEQEKRATESANLEREAAVTRRAGLMVAVRVNSKTQSLVIDILRHEAAEDIERAEGQWRDGNWVDFDPLQPPSKIDAPPAN
jgi:hypothetical protein